MDKVERVGKMRMVTGLALMFVFAGELSQQDWVIWEAVGLGVGCELFVNGLRAAIRAKGE